MVQSIWQNQGVAPPTEANRDCRCTSGSSFYQKLQAVCTVPKQALQSQVTKQCFCQGHLMTTNAVSVQSIDTVVRLLLLHPHTVLALNPVSPLFDPFLMPDHALIACLPESQADHGYPCCQHPCSGSSVLLVRNTCYTGWFSLLISTCSGSNLPTRVTPCYLAATTLSTTSIRHSPRTSLAQFFRLLVPHASH